MAAGAPPGTVRFTFDGQAVEALQGQSIAAALLAAGFRALRLTRTGGAPRGLFCGIGACFECLVDVNGAPALRACLEPARDGDRVTTSRSTGDTP
jgi:predicted molibdopterin-dependent oxidoreductase YjgC